MLVCDNFSNMVERKQLVADFNNPNLTSQFQNNVFTIVLSKGLMVTSGWSSGSIIAAKLPGLISTQGAWMLEAPFITKSS